MYLFSWESRAFNGRLKATHALEIPFAFNNLNRAGVDVFIGEGPKPQHVADAMHAAWTSFVRTGDPNCGAIPQWPPYDTERRATMVFDNVSEVAGDPCGVERRLWDGRRWAGFTGASGPTAVDTLGGRAESMRFGELIEERHSVRAFEEREVERARLATVLHAARRAPSAGNLQAYRVAVARTPSLRRRLARAALDQDFVAQAPVILVFLADSPASGVKYGRRGETLYAIQDAAIACAYAQLAACDAGLGSCWVGAFREEEVRAALGVGQDLRPVALLPLGYPAEVPKITPRRPLSEVVLNIEAQA